MGSRLKQLLFGSPSSSGNPGLKGRSYDSAVASDPPIKGSYPVAGNGPNVLDEIRRSRSKKDAASRQSTPGTFVAASTVPRIPEGFIERPRTAPHGGRPRGGHNVGTDHGRTRSGFSMKSPPTIFSSSRRNSIKSTVNVEPPPPLPSSISRSSTPKIRDIKTYQPKKVIQPEEKDGPDTSSPSFASHHRNESQTSHKSYVDLLEAHSNIRPSRDVSKHRAKASGVRNYGEDVANRNIADVRELENRLDLNSPEFSYLKSVYTSKKGDSGGGALPRGGGSHPRAASAMGHNLGKGHTSSDDIQHSRNHMKANSTQSSHATLPGPDVVYPPRSDSTSAMSSSSNGGRNDHRFTISNGIHDHRARALSSPSTTTALIYEEPEETSRKQPVSTRSTDPLLARERARKSTGDHRNPPPVSLPTSLPRFAGPRHSQPTPPVTPAPLKDRKRTASEATQTTVKSIDTKSRNGSVSYSVFPSTGRLDAQVNEAAGRAQPSSAVSNHTGMLVGGAKETPSLEGVVELTNTVDTDVNTNTLPSVTHEKVLPTRHEIREERITREIHTHDVFHRVLPVIETEILPPKHYVPSSDGKGVTEIPEHMVPGRTSNGSPSRNWEFVETRSGSADQGSTLRKKAPTQQSSTRAQSFTPANDQYHLGNRKDDVAADAPVIGFARGEPKSYRSRANSRTSVHARGNSRTSSHTPKISITKNILEPILSSKKDNVTKEGYPRTEYVWRHPPAFETASGQTHSVYVGAGLGDISSPTTAPISGETYYSDEDDIEGAEFGATRIPAEGEEDLLFRDSGYGSHGMLPGLAEKTPLAGLGGELAFDPTDFEIIRYGKVVEEDDDAAVRKAKVVGNAEGEATKGLRRIKERRSSAGSRTRMVKANEKENSVLGIEKGMNNLNVRD